MGLAVICSLRQVLRWRSTTWWNNTQAEGMKDDPWNHTLWNHTCGWHNWSGVWDMLVTEWRTRLPKKIATIQKILHHWWDKKLASPISEVDSHVEHVFREHNREADHRANVGTDGKREITVDKGSNPEKWKAVKGFWDGSCKENGRSGCGVVVKGVDRGKWVTISQIAVPLKVGKAMATEIMGVCKKLNLGNTSRCIDAILGAR